MRVDVLLQEQGIMGMSKTDLAVSPRQTVPKKYPRRRWCSTLQAKPAHNKTVCTDSKGKRQARQARRRPFPLPPFCYALPVVLFLAFCIARTGRKNNRIHMTQKQSRKQTQRKSKSKAQAKRGSVIYSNAITKKQAKKETDKQRQKEQTITSKRACKRACYYNTSKRDHALINTIPP